MLANNFHFPYPVLTAYSDDVQPPLNKHNVIVGNIEKDDSNCYITALSFKIKVET